MSNSNEPPPQAIIVRPQPVGLLPLPAGLLLIGGEEGSAADEVRKLLCTGQIPDRWPADLAFIERTLAGDLAAAHRLLTGTDLVSSVNRFVIDPRHGAYLELIEDLRVTPELRCVVEAVAFTVGMSPRTPRLEHLDGEFAAIAHLTRALALAELGATHEVGRELAAGAAAAHGWSPVLCMHLLGAVAEQLHRMEGRPQLHLCGCSADAGPEVATGGHGSLVTIWLHHLSPLAARPSPHALDLRSRPDADDDLAAAADLVARFERLLAPEVSEEVRAGYALMLARHSTTSEQLASIAAATPSSGKGTRFATPRVVFITPRTR